MNNTLNRFFKCVCFLCGLSPAFSVVHAQESARKTQLELLGEELAAESITWLEADGEKFIALWEPDTSGNSFGAILLLHGNGQTPDWPDTLKPLRTSLMQFGWSTLSIALPEFVGNDSDDKARARIQAAHAFLDQKGQHNIVIFGQGAGATRGYEFVNTFPASNSGTNAATPSVRGPVRALVMLSARGVELARDFTLPTLDLYYDEHYLDQKEVGKRLNQARKYRLPHYHQIRLLKPYETGAGEENRLTRRVRGFLNKYAKGIEIRR